MPYGLGWRFIQAFKMLTREQIIEYIVKMIELLDDSKSDSESESELNSDKATKIDFETLEDVFLNPKLYEVTIQNSEPSPDLFIEFIYIINLDDDIYTMISNYNTQVSFNLNIIPEDFVEIFISTYESIDRDEE
jgi:hypothetical protein